VKPQQQLTIGKYALFASAFLQQHHSGAEVIYTDLEPDIVLNNDGQIYDLDLNNDGIDDFTFVFTTTNFFNFTYYGGANFYFFNAMFVLPGEGNAIAAFTASSGAYAYPYVINEGLDIGPATGNFLSDSAQTLVYHFYAIIQSFYYFPIYAAGNWIFGETKKFIGLRINNTDSIHYGWARLDVAPNNKSLTIRDYAYESESNQAISTFTPLGIPDVDLSSSLYAFGNTVFFNSPDGQAIQQLQVFDLAGKLIFESTSVQSKQIEIPVPVSGIYLVEITINENQISLQLYLTAQ
jgi:hypothetical protein